MAPAYPLTEDGKFRIVERADVISGQVYRFLICDACGHWIRRRIVSNCRCQVEGCHNSAMLLPRSALPTIPRPRRVKPGPIGNARLRELVVEVARAERSIRAAKQRPTAEQADAVAEPSHDPSPNPYGIGTDQPSASQEDSHGE